MEINIDQELLDEINIFLFDLIGYMNLKGLSFRAISFIIQSITENVDKAQNELDKAEN